MGCGPGDRIGPYEVHDLLGAGGMGQVFRAYDPRLDREVAIKLLHTPGGADATARVIREARAASALNHPNICHIYDVGESEHGPWIAMELIAGDPLDRCVPPGGLSVDRAIDAGRQIAAALAHAHGRGIVHRDLKSGNCILSVDGRLAVLDFGLAGKLPELVAEEVTRTPSVQSDSLAGTPAYMAPEMLRGERGDARSDLWALGAVLYELASGRRPFAAPTVYELASAILTRAPDPLPSSVLEPYRRIVERLLRKDAGERFQTAADVVTALDACAGATPGPVEVPLPERRRVGRGVVAALAAILAGGALWWTAISESQLELGLLELVSTFEGSHAAPALSPDGRTVAFVATDAAGVPQVWLRSLAGGDPSQLTTGTAAAHRPRWMPDASGIVFARAGEGIWMVPPLGGTVRRLVDAGTNPDISRDGRAMTWETPDAIWIGMPDGSGARRIDGVQPRYYSVPRLPALSPDGRFVAYFHPELGPNGDFWIISADGGEPRRLTSDLREGGAPLWTPDGRYIIFSSTRAGSRTLWQITREGGEPVPLTTGAGEDDMPDLSADGTRLVFTNTRNSWDIRLARDRDAERVVLQRRTELLFPRFSPDGTRLTFFGRASRAVAVFVMERDGTGLRQLTAGDDLNHHPRWSGDGNSVFFYQASPAVGLRQVPAAGGPSIERWPWSWEVHHGVDFAPDDERLVYSRLRPLGATTADEELTIVWSIATEVEVRLPAPHMHHPRFSRAGHAVAGARHEGSPPGGSVVICDAAGEACRTVASHALLGPVAWAPDDRRVYFLRSRSREGLQQLWSVGVDGAGERHERDIGPFGGIDRHFDVSPAGELVWAPVERGRSELWTATVR